MKRKKLPTKKHKGLYIYCSSCKQHFSWTEKLTKDKDGKIKKEKPNCSKFKNKLSSCKNFHKHKYKVRVYIPGSTDREKSKTLLANSYKEAVIESIEFENNLLANLNINRINDYKWLLRFVLCQ